MSEISTMRHFPNATISVCPRDQEAAELFYFALHAGGRPVFEHPQGAMVHLRFVVEHSPSSSFPFNQNGPGTSRSSSCSSSHSSTQSSKDEEEMRRVEEHEKMDEERFLEIELTESIRLYGWMEEIGSNRHNPCTTPTSREDAEEGDVGGDGDGEEVVQLCVAADDATQTTSNETPRNSVNVGPESPDFEKKTVCTVVGRVPLRLHVWSAPGQHSLSLLLQEKERKKENYRRYKEEEQRRGEAEGSAENCEEEKSLRSSDVLSPKTTHVLSNGRPSSSAAGPMGDTPCSPPLAVSPLPPGAGNSSDLQTGPSWGGPSTPRPATDEGEDKPALQEGEDAYQEVFHARNDTPYIRQATEAIITYSKILSEHAEIVAEEVYEEKEKGNMGEVGASYHLIQFHTSSPESSSGT